MNERGEPSTYIEDPKKAQHEAIVQDTMRDSVKALEAEAAGFAAEFDATGDVSKQNAALG